MRPTDLGREALFPLTHPTLSVAMVTFFLLGQLARAAGLLGLWLAVVLVPAMARFLLGVTEARIYGLPIEAPGIEKFNWIASPWSLMALAWLGGCAWLVGAAASASGHVAAGLAGLLVLLVLPAPLGMLALSRAWSASLNPFALASFARVCGIRYLWIPAVLAAAAVAILGARALGAPALVVDLAHVYALFLLFTLTGAVTAASDAVTLVQAPIPEEAEPEQVLQRLDEERAAVLDHAYGLISRGNRAGGLGHLEAYIEQSDFALEDSAWFFENMLRWETSDPALFFAQRYLTRLLDQGQSVIALKLLARCALEHERFRPAAADRERVAELIEAHNRTDLRKLVD